MSQNIPPGPNNPYGTPAGDADHSPNNPYFAQRQEQVPEPNLDAGAPVLKSADAQRLNRKALLFLGAILLLILAMGWLVFRNANREQPEPVKVKEERVEIPELPQVAAVPPVELVEAPPQAELPPMPATDELPPEESDGQLPTAPQPTLLERRIAALGGNAPVSPTGSEGAAVEPPPGLITTTPPPATAEFEPATAAALLRNPDALLVRGTYIRCILETRIITDVPGFASCIVTEPVYSINGRRLLLPRGSKVSGRYAGEPSGPRVAVTWDRIITPNGLDVTMRSPGIDNLGSSGHPGDYNAHWGYRISAALLISLISDGFKYAAAEEGSRTTTVTSGGTIIDQPFESTTARTMERLANQALDKAANRPATVTINQGTMVSIYVAKDVDFTGVLAR